MSRRESPRTGGWLLVAAVVAVGLNLRGPIVAVAPVLDDLRDELGITETAAGLLTSVPVLCFAAVSPFVATLARRFGSETAVAAGLALLAVGIAVRPWAGYGLMLAGTLLMGLAIAGGNVLLPVIARRDFPTRTGPMMSAVTASLLVSATIPALLTAPLAGVAGWRPALAVWAVLAVLALGIWWRATAPSGGRRTPAAATAGPVAAPVPTAWRAYGAWELGVFFGLQSLLFYATTAWLPTMLQDDGGLDAATAGTALSVFQLLGIAGAVAVPMLIRGKYVRYPVAVALAALWVIFFTGLLLAPGSWPLWCALGGVAQGGGIAMALSLIAVRSSGGDAARTVSAVVQTVGYVLGAIGPVVVGGITAATAGWVAPFGALIAVSGMLGVLGVRAVAPRMIR